MSPMNQILVVVLLLPFRGKRNEFKVLGEDPRYRVEFVTPEAWDGEADLLVLQGSGKTISDYKYLCACGGATKIRNYVNAGGKVFFTCAGMQMAGEWMFDPLCLQGDQPMIEGFGFLPLTTWFSDELMVCESTARFLVGPHAGKRVKGVEVHSGDTRASAPNIGSFHRLFEVEDRDYNFVLPAVSGTDPMLLTVNDAQHGTAAASNGLGAPAVHGHQPISKVLQLGYTDGTLHDPASVVIDGITDGRQFWASYLHCLFNEQLFRDYMFGMLRGKEAVPAANFLPWAVPASATVGATV